MVKRIIVVLAVVIAFSPVAGEKLSAATSRVDGMTWGSCATAVKHVLTHIDGVVDARVSYKENSAVVSFDASRVGPEQIIRTVQEKLPYKMTLAGRKSPSASTTSSCVRPTASPTAQRRTSDVTVDSVSFYEVGLVCKAAPKIGCGSKAKPVLLTLSAHPRIDGVWLNEAGTHLAIAWKASAHRMTMEQLDQLLTDSGIAIHDIASEDQPALAASFAANAGWYDASSVDQLSQQEARLIAARIVKRLNAKTAISADQRTALQNAIEKACFNGFTKGGGDIDEQVFAVAKQARLDARATAALREVVALGYRPLPHED
ncbi:MAG: hypothetical protein NVSMB68_11850 [Thermoanaerobaculia bacterium]